MLLLLMGSLLHLTYNRCYTRLASIVANDEQVETRFLRIWLLKVMLMMQLLLLLLWLLLLLLLLLLLMLLWLWLYLVLLLLWLLQLVCWRMFVFGVAIELGKQISAFTIHMCYCCCCDIGHRCGRLDGHMVVIINGDDLRIARIGLTMCAFRWDHVRRIGGGGDRCLVLLLRVCAVGGGGRLCGVYDNGVDVLGGEELAHAVHALVVLDEEKRGYADGLVEAGGELEREQLQLVQVAAKVGQAQLVVEHHVLALADHHRLVGERRRSTASVATRVRVVMPEVGLHEIGGHQLAALVQHGGEYARVWPNELVEVLAALVRRRCCCCRVVVVVVMVCRCWCRRNRCCCWC